MDSFRGQGGIQMLLTAEQEAQRIVSAARNAKLARLKQAKDEAETEVADYRSRMEEEYQKQVSQTSQSAAAKRLEEENETKIQSLKDSGSKVSKDVVELLMKYVTAVKV